MFQSLLIGASSVLVMISPVVYMKAILAGKAKPHRVTRFVLLIITTLATMSLFAQHDTVAIWLAGISSIQGFFVFFLSLRYGVGGWSKVNVGCMVIAGVGIVLWQTTKDERIGLYCAVLADFVGMIPTLLKTYRFPETEVWIFYGLDAMAGFLTLLAVSQWHLDDLLFPLYILLINACMVFLCQRKVYKKVHIRCFSKE